MGFLVFWVLGSALCFCAILSIGFASLALLLALLLGIRCYTNMRDGFFEYLRYAYDIFLIVVGFLGFFVSWFFSFFKFLLFGF